jgi:hypothetical protein
VLPGCRHVCLHSTDGQVNKNVTPNVHIAVGRATDMQLLPENEAFRCLNSQLQFSDYLFHLVLTIDILKMLNGTYKLAAH